MHLDPELFKAVWLLIAALAVGATAVVVGACSVILLTALKIALTRGWRRALTIVRNRLGTHDRHECSPSNMLMHGFPDHEPPPNFLN